MSESPDFFKHAEPRARREHKCCECNRIIRQGSRYHRISGKWGGEVETFKICRWCESIREMWSNHVYPEDGPCYGDLRNFINES